MREIWHSRRRRVSFALGWGFAFLIETSDECPRRGFTLYVHLIYVAAWFHLPWFWRPRAERQYGFRVFDCALWWSFDEPTMSWSSRDKWWRRFTIRPARILFGREKCVRVDAPDALNVVVPMPEGSYPATVRRADYTWTRSRLPFWKRKRTDWYIDIPHGIPFNGKGENSWDCGDDGLFGTGGDSPEDAVANAVKSVLRNRKKYGETSETRGRIVWARPGSVSP